MRDSKLLIFDLGNVILRHDNPLVVQRMTAASSNPAEAVRIEEIFAQSGCSAGRVTAAQFFADTRERLGLASFDEFETLWNCHFSHDAGMEELVKALATKYRVVVLSNTNDSHWRYLMREYDIMTVPHALYTSFELGLEKPDPAIYRHVLQVENCAAEDAIFIDDKQENVNAANALGIHGLHFTDRAMLERDLVALGIHSPLPQAEAGRR